MSDPRNRDPRFDPPPLQEDDIRSQRLNELESSNAMWGWVAGAVVLALVLMFVFTRGQVNDTTASMVVDIGGGTTDVSVISLGGIVNSKPLRLGGDETDDAIISHITNDYPPLLGERSAGAINVHAGASLPPRAERSTHASGARRRPGPGRAPCPTA